MHYENVGSCSTVDVRSLLTVQDHFALDDFLPSVLT